MILGFTGSGGEPTAAQELALRSLIGTGAWTEAHHGDCVGADAMFDRVCVALGIRRHAHPGSDSRGKSPKRAHCPVEVTHPVRPYLDRNKDIVAACELLVACPSGPERLRSGTWSTVRHARKTGRRVVVIWPDGRREG